jgi:hypothetical protein
LEGVELVGWKHPYNGEMELKLRANASIQTGSTGYMEVSFETPEALTLKDVKACLVSEPLPEDRTSGRQRSRVGNLQILRVWREPPSDDPTALTWDSEGIGWNEENVGKYAIDRDPEGNDLLLLYANMDHSELVRERSRRLQVYGTAVVKIFERRYAAYVGYHLWLYSQEAESTPASESTDETLVSTEPQTRRLESAEQEFAMEKEMQRVAKTIIQALRSERDILAEETEAD